MKEHEDLWTIPKFPAWAKAETVIFTEYLSGVRHWSCAEVNYLSHLILPEVAISQMCKLRQDYWPQVLPLVYARVRI